MKQNSRQPSQSHQDIIEQEQLDESFVQIIFDIEKIYKKLNKCDRKMVEQWTSKLCQVSTNLQWKKNRNQISQNLYKCCNDGILQFPFNQITEDIPIFVEQKKNQFKQEVLQKKCVNDSKKQIDEEKQPSIKPNIHKCQNCDILQNQLNKKQNEIDQMKTAMLKEIEDAKNKYQIEEYQLIQLQNNLQQKDFMYSQLDIKFNQLFKDQSKLMSVLKLAHTCIQQNFEFMNKTSEFIQLSEQFKQIHPKFVFTKIERAKMNRSNSISPLKYKTQHDIDTEFYNRYNKSNSKNQSIIYQELKSNDKTLYQMDDNQDQKQNLSNLENQLIKQKNLIIRQQLKERINHLDDSQNTDKLLKENTKLNQKISNVFTSNEKNNTNFSQDFENFQSNYHSIESQLIKTNKINQDFKHYLDQLQNLQVFLTLSLGLNNIIILQKL